MDQNPKNPSQKTTILFTRAQICLRTFAIATALAAACLMATNKQNADVFGNTMHAQYNYTSAFIFFVAANAIGCATTLLTLTIFVGFFFARSQRTSDPSFHFYLLLHDLVAMTLVAVGSAAATAIGVVGKYGNNRIGWMAICEYFGKFCGQSTAAIALSYLSFCSLMILTIISADRARQFHPKI